MAERGQTLYSRTRRVRTIFISLFPRIQIVPYLAGLRAPEVTGPLPKVAV